MKARLIRKIAARPVDARGCTVYVAKIWSARRGRYILRRQVCRIEATDWSDGIMAESGCAGDFIYDFRRRDRAEGCPACKGEF